MLGGRYPGGICLGIKKNLYFMSRMSGSVGHIDDSTEGIASSLKHVYIWEKKIELYIYLCWIKISLFKLKGFLLAF